MATLKPLYEMNKAELVQAIFEESDGGVSRQSATDMTVGRIRLLLKALRPNKKKPTTLPAGVRQWKKAWLVSLAESRMPEIPEADLHCMTREEILLRLEHHDTELLEEGGEDSSDLPSVSSSPRCPKCRLIMIFKTNRLTDEGFYGCAQFPICRATLPLTQGRLLPTKVVQEALDHKKETAKAREAKAKAAVAASRKSRPRDYRETPGSASDGSTCHEWQRVPVPGGMEEEEGDSQSPSMINANVTPEELRLIRDSRRAKAKEELKEENDKK
jgi:hypothetical protein